MAIPDISTFHPILLPIGLAGLVLGSFFSVLVSRLHSGEGGILTGRSHCARCGHPLSARDLVPIFSWIFARGNCRYCDRSISIVYPLLELSTSILFVAIAIGIALRTTGGFDALMFSGRWWWAVMAALVIIPVAWYDALFGEIPDALILSANRTLFVMLALASLAGWAVPFFGTDPFGLGRIAPLWEGLLAGGAAYLFFCLQILVPAALHAGRVGRYSIFRETVIGLLAFPIWMLTGYPRDDGTPTDDEEEIPSWIGWGDLRIAWFFGLVGGWWALLALAMTYLVGALYGTFALATGRGRTVPFGPFLAVGLIIGLAYGPIIVTDFLALLG